MAEETRNAARSHRAVPTEEDILLKQEIPMRELLGNEAAETLLTYFTAPHISLPLVLRFSLRSRGEWIYTSVFPAI